VCRSSSKRNSERWAEDIPEHAFEAYAAARAVRQRLANLGAALQVWANNGFNAQDPHERAARYDHIRNDDVLAALELSFMTGFDSLPQDLTRSELAARLPTPGK